MEFKAGDKVRFIKEGMLGCETEDFALQDGFVVGNVYTVKTVTPYGRTIGVLEETPNDFWICAEHFELVKEGERQFKVGDRVRQKKYSPFYIQSKESDGVIIAKYGLSGYEWEVRWYNCGTRRFYNNEHLEHADEFGTPGYNEQIKKESDMNATIVKLFDKTEDAVLVEKHLNGLIGSDTISFIVLKSHAKEILAEAKRLEEESKKK